MCPKASHRLSQSNTPTACVGSQTARGSSARVREQKLALYLRSWCHMRADARAGRAWSSVHRIPVERCCVDMLRQVR
eukprot:8798392-Alexandrium_andersonii.AAC.1